MRDTIKAIGIVVFAILLMFALYKMKEKSFERRCQKVIKDMK